jgi:uncharacterized damage-inducible protein DinB
LRQGDVLVGMDGLAVTDVGSLATMLSQYRPGARITVNYVRGRDPGVAEVRLTPRPVPEISFVPQQVVEQARGIRRPALERLRAALEGLTEEDAAKKPVRDAWSVREILAHLSASERAQQQWMADVISGATPGQYGANAAALYELVAMTLAAAPTAEGLLQRLEQDMEETLALFSALRPEIVAMRARYRAMAESLLAEFHWDTHLTQIHATIEAVNGGRV